MDYDGESRRRLVFHVRTVGYLVLLISALTVMAARPSAGSSGPVAPAATRASVRLQVSGLNPVATVGVPSRFVVRTVGGDGQLDPMYGAVVRLSSTDRRAEIPPPYTFTPEDGGRHEFSVTFQTSGSQQLTVSDTANPAGVGTFSIRVIPPVQSVRSPVPRVLTLVTPAVSGPEGRPINFVVEMHNANGSVAHDYRGVVQFRSTTPDAVLPGDYAFSPADAGRRQFSTVFAKAGEHTVTVTDRADPSLTADLRLTVTSPTAVALEVSGVARGLAVRQRGAITVRAVTASGETATGYRGTVLLSDAREGTAILPARYTYSATDRGQHQFDIVFDSPGEHTLVARDAVDADVWGEEAVMVLGRPATPGSSSSSTSSTMSPPTSTITAGIRALAQGASSTSSTVATSSTSSTSSSSSTTTSTSSTSSTTSTTAGPSFVGESTTTSSSSTSSSTSSTSTTSTTAMKREDAQVSNPNPQAGQTVKVTGGNTEPFAPNQDLSIELRSDSVALGITRSLGDGTYAAEVIIPSDTAAGTHTIVVAGLHRDGGRLESSVEIELSGTATADSQSGSASRSAAGAQQGGALMAATGWSPGLLMLAAVLALTGASLVRVGRRRDSLDFLGSRRDHGQFRRQ